MEIWDKSPDVQKLLQEVNMYSTRHYETATGLETWFMLPDLKTVVPPPRWKMAIVVFIAAYTTSLLARSFLSPLLSEWPLIASTVIFTTILVVSLTYIALPAFSQLLRRWLYPGNWVTSFSLRSPSILLNFFSYKHYKQGDVDTIPSFLFLFGTTNWEGARCRVLPWCSKNICLSFSESLLS